MQLPLLPGTILQNRYHLLRVLGQGGFGRTYLVEDQTRFNELCVLKEYSPKHTGTDALRKSKELFQREAETLYKIQHPQIPQFRATFEQDKRLFLAQDYIEGKTYRTLINERKKQGQMFSEMELVQFLLQILPVLEHIHSKGIIHRDISPENIICRQSDRLPVLIDFGTVKQRVLPLVLAEDFCPETVVGKQGFAPCEQLQTGEVYPNSDLYALAVTVLVLMTGRKPLDLFDKSTMIWRWQQEVPTVHHIFAAVLNRMLNPSPYKRYESATDVVRYLRSLQGVIHHPKASSVSNLPTKPKPSPQPKIPRNNPSPPRGSKTTNLKNPWTVAVIGIGLILLLILFLLIKQGKNPPPPPPSPNPPIPTRSPEPPTPTQTNISLPSPGLGETIFEKGRLKQNETVIYNFPSEKGLHLNTLVKEGRILMTVYISNQKQTNYKTKQWNSILPVTGYYSIELSLENGVTEADYTDYTIEISVTEPKQPTPR